ncbi:MAG TPA: lipoate--protein ligase [Mariniphaga sp.]|nr:lipoate--protein ligase [Mariniphaga sp.]
MLCIHLKKNDPFFCLATEEYLLKNFKEDIFMLWQSEDTVVIGKHQNAMAEVNYPYIIANDIKVARRISGGGTVFHDAGNLNFAYIKNVDSPSQISFSRFVQPIVEALGELGVHATVSGRNDLLLDNKKISGNAEHIFKNRVLHHGTLLYNSNLETLGLSIKVAPGKYEGKAVQSKRSVVTNILPYLKDNISLREFTSYMLKYESEKPGSTLYDLSGDDLNIIQQLVKEKFMTWDWNFGYSPKYTFKNEDQIEDKHFKVELQVERGHINNADISGTYFTSQQASDLNELLIGERHTYNDILQNVRNINPDIQENLINLFF